MWKTGVEGQSNLKVFRNLIKKILGLICLGVTPDPMDGRTDPIFYLDRDHKIPT